MVSETRLGHALNILKEHVQNQIINQLAGSLNEANDRGINRDNLQWVISQVNGTIEKSFDTGGRAVFLSIKE